MQKRYNPATGTWETVSGGNKTDTTYHKPKTTPKKATTKKTTTPKKVVKKTKKSSSKKKTKKKRKKSFNYFTATINIKPTDTTFRIKPANIVSVKGVGKYLGGRFYVQDVTKTIDSNGLSISITVIKVKFSRSSVKPKKPRKSKKTNKKAKVRTHKVKKGETLLSICNKYFKKKSKETKKKHLKKMKKKNNIKDEKKKLKVGRKIYIV